MTSEPLHTDHHAVRTSETEVLAGVSEPAHLTTGIVSLVLGLTALMGGGSLTTALQFWTIRLTSDAAMDGDFGYRAFQTLNALPVILLGIIALVLGLAGARSSHPAARAVGRAGAIIGVLALVSGVLTAVLMQSAGMY